MIPVIVSDDEDVGVANSRPRRTNKDSECLANSNNVAQVFLASHRRLQAQHGRVVVYTSCFDIISSDTDIVNGLLCLLMTCATSRGSGQSQARPSQKP